MMQFQLLSIVYASISSFAGRSFAHKLPPLTPYNTFFKSPFVPKITTSHRELNLGLCTTVFASQKQYTGYIGLPPLSPKVYQQGYPINNTFWFLEASSIPKTAPLTIWLNGRPESSSMISLFQERGPCRIVQLQNGSYGTQKHEWRWSSGFNLLFINSSTQVEFSYGRPRDVSMTPIENLTEVRPNLRPGRRPSWVYMDATLASWVRGQIRNASNIIARAVWHFSEAFWLAFPQHNTGQHPGRTSVHPIGVHLFAASDGGQYDPVFSGFFEDQKNRRHSDNIPAAEILETQVLSFGIIKRLEYLRRADILRFIGARVNSTEGSSILHPAFRQSKACSFNSLHRSLIDDSWQ